MQKEELLQLLRDPEICREIFLIMKNGGKPSVPSASGADKLSAVKEDDYPALMADLEAIE